MAIESVIPLAFQATQADIDAGLANNVPAGSPIFVIDNNKQPTGKEYTASVGNTAPVEGSGGVKNNFAATAAPLVTNDSSQGYSVGSRWIDTTEDESYICIDATTGAAVWSKTTVGTIAEVAGLPAALDAKLDDTDIVNDLTTGGITKVLSAEQGKNLETTKALKTALVSTVALDAGYPTATTARKLTLAGKKLGISQITASVFSGIKMGGTSILDTSLGDYITNTLNTSVVGEVSFWIGVWEDPNLKCVKVKCVDNGDSIDVFITETGHWTSDVRTDAGWTTTGGVPASRQSTATPASSNGAGGYGLEAMSVTFNNFGIVKGTIVNDTLTSTSTSEALSAAKGKTLKDTADTLATTVGLKEVTANKNVNNGYAGLDSSGKVASAQLPSYVDDIVEGANLAAFPGTGETGKIYVALDTNKPYRWSGSVYVEISASPGSTDAVTEGTLNLYFTIARAKAAAVADAIANGVLDVAPSQNAVFDALVLKQDALSAVVIDDATPSTTKVWSSSKAKTYTDALVAQANTYKTYSNTDVATDAIRDGSVVSAVGTPALTSSGAVATSGAFVSNIAETHASTKWETDGVMSVADAINLLSFTPPATAYTALGDTVAIKAAHIDSNGNQSQRSNAVNTTLAALSIAMSAGYPTAAISRTFDHSTVALVLTNIKTTSFTTVTMGGGYVGTGNSTATSALIANTLNTGVANEVTCWIGHLDGSNTKCNKLKFTVLSGNILVNVIESAYWATDVRASASWTTSGGEPASKIAAAIADSISAAGYGTAALTLEFSTI